MATGKELDIGNSDFKSTIENDNYYVDKSLLIREIIKAQKQVILLPRPRRFGKTLNLSMLRYFFDINHPENQGLFKNLNIWQTENEVKQKQGKYPVIYLSFKDAKHGSWNDTLALIKIELAKLFRVHSYLLKGDLLTKIEKTEYTKIADRSADITDFEICIKQLSEYLFKYHGQKAVVLIDEYDTPIQAGYKRFYDDAISFMRNLMSGAFKDNDYLYKGVITGILRVSRESIFTGLNNVSVYSVLDDEFSDKFGFTEMETKQILNDFNVPTDYAQIKKWYDGYKFGNTDDIYNPWSILNYAIGHKSGFKPFWVNTSSDELLKERLKERDASATREQLLKLINDEPIEKTIDENFVFTDLDTDKELLWTLLTFSGYLTVASRRDIDKYKLKIPNYEIKYVFQNIILKWLSVDVKIRRTLLEDATNHLINNEINEFERGFKKIIGDTFSYFDTKGEPENVYQSYVLGLLAIIGDDYIIKSNRESGEGRYDIMLIPHDKSRYGIVIEIKQIDRGDNENEQGFRDRIDRKIDEAKAQIDKNQYYKELVANKIPNIIKLPIVFAGKVPYIVPKKPEINNCGQ
jgi:hypothetical protein